MFDIKINLYGLMIILSLIANIIAEIFLLKRTDIISEEKTALIALESIGVIIGAILLHNFEIGNFKLYKQISLGLSSYGALIGAILMMLLYCLVFKRNVLEMGKYLLMPIPLMYGIGKLGCFFAGCCHGIEYNGPLSIVYNYSKLAEAGVHYFPIQLVESIVFILIFIILIILYKKNYSKITEIELITCAFSKFALEYLRISHVDVVISTTQIISIVFFLLGIGLLFIKKPLKK